MDIQFHASWFIASFGDWRIISFLLWEFSDFLKETLMMF